MTHMEEQIRKAARDLLESKQVSSVIGYEQDPQGKIRPVIIHSVEETDRLAWSRDCNLNLVTYLHDRKLPPGKGQPVPITAVVVRPCDARAINLLINEQQIKRENVKIIGIECAGTDIHGKPRLACQYCQERKPVTFDVLIESDEPIQIPVETDSFADVREMEQWTSAERLHYWLGEFDRCIRCYACRQACPGCYCSECVAEQVDPHWTSIALEVPEKYFFHVMRAFHLAGRCVGCDACEAACPMDIPLSKLNRKIAKEVRDLFDYRTGDSPESLPLLCRFNPNERLEI
jgi:formate dehydrogenase (coenzyme F420) beta subunit